LQLADALISPETDPTTLLLAGRFEAIAAAVRLTVEQSHQSVGRIIDVFMRWMQDGTNVRVLGAGRARLAACIAANRLAHGGARVSVEGEITPMPHSIRGGGVLAASASGQAQSVLKTLTEIRRHAPHVVIVGIAAADAAEFSSSCDYFIGIREDANKANQLSALADVAEFVIAEVLDALVAAAGRKAGFDRRRWELGHEDIGPTGPYNPGLETPKLRFSYLGE
jgi:D-arabinose 5-phosphate isomerase GutQ